MTTLLQSLQGGGEASPVLIQKKNVGLNSIYSLNASRRSLKKYNSTDHCETCNLYHNISIEQGAANTEKANQTVPSI
jgi:hypothetical protein